MSQTRQLVVRSHLKVDARQAFAWHTRPGAFERLMPPWDPPRVAERSGGIQDGARVTLQLTLGPMPVRWELEHHGYREGEEFRDRQLRGPFAHWEHVHRFVPAGDQGFVMEDAISYELPGGALGARLGGRSLEDKLLPVFAFRHRRLAADLHRHAGLAPMTIAVTGASGFIGSALCAFLSTGGHRVRRLVRRKASGPDEIYWDPDKREIDAAALEGVDAVVHLAGENVGGGRWTAERKRRIRESRTEGTGLLARTLAGLSQPPRVFVSMSAVGYYGPRGEESIDESTGPGADFLAQVAVAWEEAARPAADRGIRVAHPRLGTVMDPRGGALERLLPIFRLGAGGRVGAGTQVMSWVTLDDTIGAVHKALHDERVSGAFNLTTPAPVSNAELTRALAQVLSRPAFLPVPSAALGLAFGEMGETLLLSGARVLPRRLQEWGFAFLWPEIEPALREMLGRTPLPVVERAGSTTTMTVVAG